jgi:hypothetical protein
MLDLIHWDGIARDRQSKGERNASYLVSSRGCNAALCFPRQRRANH